MKKANKTASVVRTTAQQLGSLIKSARDIMRKDSGLNGDIDRLPMLTWVMFLKFLDDMEQYGRTSPSSLARSSGPASRHLTVGETGRRKRTASPATNSLIS